MDADVLIVGAGPTGLMLANQLARWGITRFRLIDRHAGPAQESRALGVQARTLEIYAHLGIAGRALELGRRTIGATMWARGRRAAHVPLGDIGRELSPFPFLLILGQDDNELLLGESLSRLGHSVEWNTELVGLTQHEGKVEAKIRRPDGNVELFTTAWVAGCDGARSSVREWNKIDFEGAPYEHVFFVADTRVVGPMVPDELNVYLWSDGFHLFFPMRGDDHWRVVGILPPSLSGRTDLTLDDVAPSIREEAGADLTFQECRWFSTYRIHHRRAARFRDRRCFLLGDAAHIHSPVGAQGMNTGLQDAYNLAWKLALVVRGGASESLLDTYEAERIPVAQALLSSTDKGFSILVSGNPLASAFRTHILPRLLARAMHVAKARTIAFRTISQIGIQYRSSRASESLPGLPEAAPRAGDRFPWLRLSLTPGGPAEDFFPRLDDTRFNLVVFGENGAGVGVPAVAAPRDLLRTHVVPNDASNESVLVRAGIPRPSFYLLRPDGYIGLCGPRLDAATIERYLSARLGFSA
jgi:2-polyprenyl-6-methoxyphenol hydroxylase-like FAD-dependent oxidoreductase